MTDTFKHHELSDVQKLFIDDIRIQAERLEGVIIMACINSRERSLALTNLEQTIMWANKAIAIHGANESNAKEAYEWAKGR